MVFNTDMMNLSILKKVKNINKAKAVKPKKPNLDVDDIQNYLAILREIDTKFPCLLSNDSILNNALRRYETCWIPLLSQISTYQDFCLVPPLDVEWIWMCHMIRPKEYASDIQKAISRLRSSSSIDIFTSFRIVSGLDMREKGLSKANELWNSLYSDEPFHIVDTLSETPMTSPANYEDATSNFKSSFSCDVISIAQNSKTFMYHVTSMPHYMNAQFIKSSISRYFQFINILNDNSNTALAAPFDIALAWRVHMSNPSDYLAHIVIGRAVPTDSSLSFKEGICILEGLWKTKSAGQLFQDGTIFRGCIRSDEYILRNDLFKSIENLTFDIHNENDGKNLPYRIVERKISVNHDGFYRQTQEQTMHWIHNTTLKTYSNNSPKIVFNSSLCEGTKSESVLSGCVHAMGADMVLCRRAMMPTTIEISKGNSSQPFPLATAHTVHPVSIYKKHSRMYQIKSSTFLLRVSGRDIGMLYGWWNEITNIEKGTLFMSPGINASWGLCGSLGLSWYSFSTDDTGLNNQEWKDLPFMYDNIRNRERRSGYRILNGGNSIQFDIGSGSIDFSRSPMGFDLVFAYLVSITAANLFVQLQPRAEPVYDVYGAQSTMFPQFLTQQGAYPLLRAAGAEQFLDGNRTGIPQLMAQFPNMLPKNSLYKFRADGETLNKISEDLNSENSNVELKLCKDFIMTFIEILS